MAGQHAEPLVHLPPSVLRRGPSCKAYRPLQTQTAGKRHEKANVQCFLAKLYQCTYAARNLPSECQDKSLPSLSLHRAFRPSCFLSSGKPSRRHKYWLHSCKIVKNSNHTSSGDLQRVEIMAGLFAEQLAGRVFITPVTHKAQRTRKLPEFWSKCLLYCSAAFLVLPMVRICTVVATTCELTSNSVTRSAAAVHCGISRSTTSANRMPKRLRANI